MGKFDTCNEASGKSFRTQALDHRDFQRVADTIAIIEEHFISRNEWNLEFRKGSITLQVIEDQRKVIKVFIDYGNELAYKNDLRFLTDDPMVIGVEISHFDPFTRESLRNFLSDNFKYYVDPRKGINSKWYFNPRYYHFYDLIFLEKGQCEFDIDGSRAEKIAEEIRIELSKISDKEE